jgi:predicted transcriptional regulator
MAKMRRIQVVIDPELDDRLEREATARGTSKSALVRDCVERELSRHSSDNGLRALVGLFPEGEPGETNDAVDHDEIIYEWGFEK